MQKSKRIKSISFTDEYIAEYEYVSGLKNASKYICDLIREDIKSKGDDVSILRAQVLELMNKLGDLDRKNK